MTDEEQQKFLDMVRKTMPDQIAKDILEVNVVDPNIMKELYENSKSEEELVKEGFKPVSGMKLVWTKE